MPTSDDFFEIVETLFDTLTDREVNCLLVGGVALLSYVEGRNTQDIALILSRTDLEELHSYHAIYSPLFQRREQREQAINYLNGEKL